MNDLLDLIFSNPLFLILIIGGLISLFRSGSGNKNEQQQQRSQSPRQPEQSRQRQPGMGQHSPQSQSKERVVRTTSSEERRQKQLEHLTSQFGGDTKDIKQDAVANSNEHSGLTSRPKIADKRRKAETASLHNEQTKRRLRKKFQNNLTRNGLIDSVVMSEVLGSPRARKPYESVVNQRRR